MRLKTATCLTSIIKLGFAIVFVGLSFMPSCTYEKGEVILPAERFCDSISKADSTIVSYTCDVQPILEAYCTLACHTSNSALGTPHIDSYGLLEVVADDGRLMCSINWDAGCDKMPYKSGTKIDSMYRATIQEWINQGKPQ